MYHVLCPDGFPIPPRNHSNKHMTFLLQANSFDLSAIKQHGYWSSDFTVPLYLAILLLPLLNFKSPTFFTKFNSLGNNFVIDRVVHFLIFILCLGTVSVVCILSFVITKASLWGWNYEFTWAQDPRGFQFPDFRSTFTALTGLLSLAFFLHK